MSRHARPERPRPRPRAGLGILVVLLVISAMSGTAGAYWTTTGGGAGSAAAGTITAPTATAAATPGSPDVAISWTAAGVPSGATLDGYYVTRYLSGSPAFACGSDPDNLLPLAPRTCLDTAVANGTYTYTVTAVLSGWTATSAASAPVTVTSDVNAPTMTLAGAALVNAYLGPNGTNYRMYFRSNIAGGGSLRIAATVTDSGSGPKSATFPAVATTSWTHNLETVTTGTGSAPTITYTSSPWTWLQNAGTPGVKTITGTDNDGNTVTRTVTFRRDNSNPNGGALAVNGVTANTAGTNNSTSTTGSFSITTLTQYAETQSTTQSGLATSSLVRDTAPLVNGVCGVYAAALPISGPAPVAQSGLATGCYRYTLKGVDNVGNTASRSTVVRVDTSAPTGGVLTVNGTAASAPGSSSSNGSGSWALAWTDFTDADSGIASSTLTRAVATITNGTCGAYGTPTVITGPPTQTGTARNCYRYVLTGTNAFGLTASLTTTVVVGPFVTGVALANGPGIAGQATQGDTVVVTFSDAIAPSSLCSTWTGSGDKVLNGDNQVTASVNQVTGGDTFTVSATGCTFNLGTIALGSTGYTAATAAFGGAGAARSTITWTAATRNLTITLGATASSALAPVATSTAIYSPSTAILNTNGIALGDSFSTANVRQF